MGRSRYAGNNVIDNNHYETWPDPVTANIMGPDILDGVDTVDHVICAGERLDVISFQYYSDEDYWWVIALANTINDPFSITVGQKLKIPIDVRSILDKVQR